MFEYTYRMTPLEGWGDLGRCEWCRVDHLMTPTIVQELSDDKVAWLGLGSALLCCDDCKLNFLFFLYIGFRLRRW